MREGELKYKKFMLVMIIGILLLFLAIDASSVSEPPQVGDSTLGVINSDDSNLTNNFNDCNLTNINSDNVNLTVGVGPGKATLYLPLGFINTGKPTYIWSKVKTAQFYNLLVFDSFGDTVINQWFKAESLRPDRKSRLSATPSITLTPGDYTWQIETWSSSGTTLSDVNPFTVCTSKSVPEKPLLISPKGTIGTDDPVYIWYPIADAMRYHLKVASSTDLSHPVIDEWYDAADVLSNRGCVVKPDVSLDEGSYRWWVQAGNCLGNGSWSNFLSFKVSPTLPGKVSPISPNGLISTRTPVFVWTASSSATEYHLWVENDTDPVFDVVVAAEEVTQGDRCYSRSPIILPFSDIDFFWHVQAVNDIGEGPNSTTLWFETVCSGGEKTRKAHKFV